MTRDPSGFEHAASRSPPGLSASTTSSRLWSRSAIRVATPTSSSSSCDRPKRSPSCSWLLIDHNLGSTIKLGAFLERPIDSLLTSFAQQAESGASDYRQGQRHLQRQLDQQRRWFLMFKNVSPVWFFILLAAVTLLFLLI